MNSGQGFTLIELVVTMMVAGILIAVAIPSYRNLVISNRLSATANEYVAAITDARMDAIRRNATTQLCGTLGNGTDTLGVGCGGVAGQIVTLDSEGDVVVVRGAPEVRKDLTLSRFKALRYGGQGLARLANSSTGPHNGLVVDLASDKISDRNRRCIYLVTGSSITTCTVTDAITCPDDEPPSCQ